MYVCICDLFFYISFKCFLLLGYYRFGEILFKRVFLWFSWFFLKIKNLLLENRLNFMNIEFEVKKF